MKDLEPGQEVSFMVLDFVDAFYRAPLHPDERHYYVVSYGGKFLRWNRIAQGSTNGPQLFGRFAALVGRLTQSVVPSSSGRLHIFIDDPILTLKGTPEVNDRNATKAILIWRMMSLGLAFHKAQYNRHVQWVGHGISAALDPLHVDVAIKKEFMEQLLALTLRIESKNQIARK